MSSFVLRLIALMCMIIDHAGLALFPNVALLRCIGRVSFPLYCFLLVQGYEHTHDLRAYARRLMLLALLSEIPFDMLIFNRVAYPMEQNVFFSLLLGLAALYVVDALRAKPMHASAVVVLLCLCAMAANVSYGWLSILLCLCMRDAGANRLRLVLGSGGALLLYSFTQLLSGVAHSWVLISLCSLFSLIPMLTFNSKPGLRHPALTWMFYASYPVHIIAIVILRAMRIVPPYFF